GRHRRAPEPWRLAAAGLPRSGRRYAVRRKAGASVAYSSARPARTDAYRPASGPGSIVSVSRIVAAHASGTLAHAPAPTPASRAAPNAGPSSAFSVATGLP